MAAWQWSNDKEHWMAVDPSIAARWYLIGGFIRIITDPATLRDCWHCGRVMEAGKVDEKGREWCGCKTTKEPDMKIVEKGWAVWDMNADPPHTVSRIHHKNSHAKTDAGFHQESDASLAKRGYRVLRTTATATVAKKKARKK